MSRRNSSGMQLRFALVMMAFLIVGCGRGRDAASHDTAAAATSVRVTEVELGRAIGSDNRISDRTDNFRPSDTIYASVVTEGSGANTRITVRWTLSLIHI